jgi:hypothetical protein
MDDNIATLCLIAVGVGLLIMLAGALFISVLRGSVFGLGLMVMRMINEQPAEETRIDLSTLPHADTQNLRAKAQSLDFDAAVSKIRQDEQVQAHSAQAAPPPNSPFPPTSPIVQPPPSVQGFPAPKSPPRQDDDPLPIK